jgi:histidine ammonia-lyase
MKSARIKPVVFEAKEGIALNNGTQAMTAVGALALVDAESLADAADIAAAMTLEAVKGKSAPFDSSVHQVRPHPGQATSARNIRQMIRGSGLVDVTDDDTSDKIQDSYALRCAPQVHGASRDALAYVRKVLEIEINAATDNPLIFPADRKSLSAGNFHGQPVALAMDFLGLAVAELGDISERRTAKLMDKNHNAGLPAFLVSDGGVQSGLMITHNGKLLCQRTKSLFGKRRFDPIGKPGRQHGHTLARHAASCGQCSADTCHRAICAPGT